MLARISAWCCWLRPARGSRAATPPRRSPCSSRRAPAPSCSRRQRRPSRRSRSRRGTASSSRGRRSWRTSRASTSVVFDKTGTLTTGELTLVGAEPAEGEPLADLLRLAASLGAASNHPVSRAAERASDRWPPPARRSPRSRRARRYRDLRTERLLRSGGPPCSRAWGSITPPPPAHDGPIAGVSRGRAVPRLAAVRRPAAAGGGGSACSHCARSGSSGRMLLTGDRTPVARRMRGCWASRPSRPRRCPSRRCAGC